MRKFSLLVVALLFATSLLNAAGMMYVPAATSESAAVVPSKQSVEKFLSLTPAKIQEVTGKKMTLKEKIAFKLAQAKMKKHMKKGGGSDIPKGVYILLAFFWSCLDCNGYNG